MAKTKIKLTEEQQAIKSHKKGHRIIMARAGTGKSSTIRMIAEPEATILCYNRAPADEMQAELTNGAQATTFHSFGNNLMKKIPSKFNKSRMHWMVRDVCFDGQNPTNSDGWELMALVKTAVTWLKEQAALPTFTLDQIKELLIDERLDVGTRIDELVEPCSELLQRSAAKTTWKGNTYHEYDLTDMQWKPYVLGLGKGICPYLYIDEGQDINPIRLALIQQWAGGHITIVGDDRQAIYQYQGSMPDCLNYFKSILKAKEYPLTTCWRCPSSHLDLARQIVPDIQDRPNCPEGTINNPGQLEEIDIDENGLLVLSRTNAPNIRAFYKFRKSSDKQVVVMNSDIAETLSALVGSEYEVKNSINAAWHTKYNNKLDKKKKYAKTATSLAVINDHDEAIQTILSNDNPKSVGEFHSMLQTQFKKPEFIDNDAIRLSSAHGSKGLQHQHVVIYGTDKFPHPKAQLEWERYAESNLYYVAQTRCLANNHPNSGTMELIESNE